MMYFHDDYDDTPDPPPTKEEIQTEIRRQVGYAVAEVQRKAEIDRLEALYGEKILDWFNSWDRLKDLEESTGLKL